MVLRYVVSDKFSFKRLNYTTLEVTLLKTPPSLRNSSPVTPPHVLGIPVHVTLPPLSEFRDAARGMGMDIFWALRTVLPITRFFLYRRLFYSILIAIETSCFRGLLLDVCSKNKLLFFAC